MLLHQSICLLAVKDLPEQLLLPAAVEWNVLKSMYLSNVNFSCTAKTQLKLL